MRSYGHKLNLCRGVLAMHPSRCSISSIAILLWLAASASVASAQMDDVGRWNLRTKSDFCLISGPIIGEVMLSVHIDRSYEWGLGLTSRKWRLKPESAVALTAHVDGTVIASGKGTALSNGAIYIPLSGASAYKALQNGQTLVLVHPGGALTFPLIGSARAMATLLDCARGLNGDTDAVVVVPEGELRTLLASYLNASGTSDYRVTSVSGGKINFTLADGTVGHVIAARGNTKSADEYTGGVIAEFSSRCAGEFASTKKDVPSTNGTVIRQIRGACRSANGETVSIEAGIARRPDGTLIRVVFGKAIDEEPADGQWREVPRTPEASGLNAGARF
jgi:hypothetical protein